VLCLCVVSAGLLLDGLEAEAARLALAASHTQGNKRALFRHAHAQAATNNGWQTTVKGLRFADAGQSPSLRCYLVGNSRQAERVAELLLAAVLAVAGVGEFWCD
jgi:hypothetical protein